MPLPVDSLNKESSPQAIRDAISESIEKCMKEKEFNGAPPTPKRCAAACYDIARRQTGKELGKKG